MQGIYNVLVKLSGAAIRTAGKFNAKLKDFSEGRKNLFERLEAQIDPEKNYFWVHAASLGEFEMAVPVLKMLKNKYPQNKTVVSFFSPSAILQNFHFEQKSVQRLPANYESIFRSF